MINISAAHFRRSGAIAALSLLLVAGSWGVAANAAFAQSPQCWSSEPTMDKGYPQWSEAPQMVIDSGNTYTASIETNRGTIVIELAAQEAPKAVNNLVCLAGAGYYDVTIFHRILAEFMIQGGDPTGTGTGGPGYTFEDELPQGDAPYVRGTLAMANAGPNTNGSQFFIVQADQPAEFTPNYTIFGHVTEGLEVLDTIALVPVGLNLRQTETSAPLVTLGIKTITIQENGAPMVAQEGGAATPMSTQTGVVETPPATQATATETPVATEAEQEAADEDNENTLWIIGGLGALAAVVGGGYIGYQKSKNKKA